MPSAITNKLGLGEKLRFFLSRSRGVQIETDLAPYLAILEEIRARDLSKQRDPELRGLARRIRHRVLHGDPPEDVLPESFALVAEVSRRTLGLAPYDEQILAGIVLQHSKLAEMQTGEGKTLAAVFPAALNGFTGRGVHILTANDYLARRDAAWMGPIYRFLGVRVDFVSERMNGSRRKSAYAADVTYLTAREAGFDLLRDSLRYNADEIVQRPYACAIVDEADFVLIDEARVPLVIAGEAPRPEVDPRAVEAIIPHLHREEDFRIDPYGRQIVLTLRGQRRVQELLHCGGMHEMEHLPTYAAVNVALHAHHLLQREVDYIVRRGRIELVDELTGRVADRRRWPYGIQPALEAKEGLAIEAEGRVYGSITVQHLMGLYPRVAAMTATAVSAAPELSDCYGLDVVIIPPHEPQIRVDAPEQVFPTEAAKILAILEEIAAAHAVGRPVLVGTRSIRESQSLAGVLRRRGVPCQVLNARHDRREAALVARAGMLGAVTISTNMAGRGTDIKLGGPEGREREAVARLGGLYVIGTNRHESRRVDLQLMGRAGRQGDPGLSRFFVSLEDPLFERYGVREFLPSRYRSGPGGGAISDRRVSREIARAQSIIANQNHEIRRTLRRYSELVEGQRRQIQAVRRRALLERLLPAELEEACARQRREGARVVGAEAVTELLIRVYLSTLDCFWADHLLYVDCLREGIHLQRLAGEDPLLFFIREVSDAFAEGLPEVKRRAAACFKRLDPGAAGSELGREGLSGPASTWTYLINDDWTPGFRLTVASAGSGAAAAAAAVAALPLLAAAPFAGLYLLARRLWRLIRRPAATA